jgi:hypothetical protein
MPFAEDPSVFLADFGVPCVFGAYSFLALLDQPDSALLMEPAHVQTREYELRYITAQAVLTRNLAGTVNGVAHKVREAPKALADGVFSTVLLTRV